MFALSHKEKIFHHSLERDTMIDILLKIDTQYNHLTPSARKIADYIRSHWRQAPYQSISDLARECGVGEATIFRFCKQLGFGGYNEFRLSLAKAGTAKKNEQPYTAYGKVTDEDSVAEMCQKLYSANRDALEQTLAMTDETSIRMAVQWLLDANRVFCCGQGGGLLAAMEAWSRFANTSPKFFVVEDLHMQILTASLLSEQDVVLYMSYSGSTLDAKTVLEPARARGAKVILVTHFPNSPTTHLADLVLLCGGSEGPLQSGSIAARMAMLFVVDILVNEFCRRDIQTTIKNKDITANALSTRHI